MVLVVLIVFDRFPMIWVVFLSFSHVSGRSGGRANGRTGEPTPPEHKPGKGFDKETLLGRGPKPYKFMGFGDIHGTKLTGLGDIHGFKPHKFIGFGDIHGPKPSTVMALIQKPF
jgi:hypothetical protein